MRKSPVGSERFVRRVYWRYVVLRVLERVGLGILTACVAALPLLGILIWRGSPAIWTAIIALAIGAAAGGIWGIVTRPNLLSAALEADRQLDWADLLSSAIIVRAFAENDPWVGAVCAAADTRCRGVSPSTVVLHRLGARAWGGIGLAAALVLAMGLVPTIVAPTRGEEPRSVSSNSLDAMTGEQSGPQGSNTAITRRTATQQEPEDARASRMNGVDQPPPAAGRQESSADADAQRGNTTNDPNGHGTGASQSKDPNSPNHLATASGTQARPGADGKHTSGGAGQSSSQPPDGGAASGQAAGHSNRSPGSAPPWASAQWAADSQRAKAAVESGRIPDSYRDVIRGYFDSP